jgi:hypothetical protein
VKIETEIGVIEIIMTGKTIMRIDAILVKTEVVRIQANSIN